MGFLLRWLAAFALLAATYNPTEWSYVRWALANWSEQTPMVVLLGLVHRLVLPSLYHLSHWHSLHPLHWLSLSLRLDPLK